MIISSGFLIDPFLCTNRLEYNLFLPLPTHFPQEKQSPGEFLRKEAIPYSCVVFTGPHVSRTLGPLLCLYCTLPWFPFWDYISIEWNFHTVLLYQNNILCISFHTKLEDPCEQGPHLTSYLYSWLIVNA